jgi:hypothetical protein
MHKWLVRHQAVLRATTTAAAMLASVAAAADSPSSSGPYSSQTLVVAAIAIIGWAVTWGITSERVSRHGRQLDKIFEILEKLPDTFITKELCAAREAVNAAPAVAQAAASTANAATGAAQAAAAAVEHATTLQHADNIATQDLLKKLLEQMGGAK